MGVIVGEHGEFLFLNKTAGVPVFPPHAGEGPSLLRELLLTRPEQNAVPWPLGYEGGLLHRLDTWTSGLVLAARNLGALEWGRQLFADGALRKQYTFLTDRQVHWRNHVIEAPLAHHPRDRRKMVWQRGKQTAHRGQWYPARTHLQRIGGGPLRLWRATLETGVMHQIRVHAAIVGLPLLGDRLYGGTSDPRGAGRFYLHHHRIDGWPGGTPTADLPGDWP